MFKGFTRHLNFDTSGNKTPNREAVEPHIHSLTFRSELYLRGEKKEQIEQKQFQSERETAVSVPPKPPTLVVPVWVNRCREMVTAVKGWPLSD